MVDYAYGMPKLTPHGPAAHAEVIRYAVKYCEFQEVSQQNQYYTIMLIISRGEIADLKSTTDAICEAAKHPISIILVGVGEIDRQKTKAARLIDGDFDAEAGQKSKLVHSKTGETCCRDIVQFVPFRKYRKEYKNLARELLAELSKQIKEFFIQKGIYPNPARLGIQGNVGKEQCV